MLLDEIQLYPAYFKEIPDLIRLEQVFTEYALSRQSFHYLIQRPIPCLWVARYRQQVLADMIVLFFPSKQLTRIYSIVVDPTQRRKGLAHTLLNWAEQLALQYHCSHIQLEVRRDNWAARYLYENQAYHYQSYLIDFYGKQQSGWKMSKYLVK